ncbi:GNAT family N-acetyltransferase [Synechococcus sp. Lug-A]|uniref:GNAT family N-acetyltransferase n=1 Tax=Synechococcus sp. Lug-A TaxID=2823740 RepID=UPI0020CE1F2A|nr:GNAT family N-acetyltransferase [Synechococcus sp. Lug-A]
MVIQVDEADLAIPEQARAVIQLMDEYARDPMGGGEALPLFVRANLVSELQKRGTVHVILAFVDGRPAGLVTCLEGFSTFACRPLLNVHDAIVSAEYRGRGICKRMLEVAEALAQRLGCCKMTLEVLEGNEAAQAAYRSCGFSGYELDPRMGKAMFWEKKLAVFEPKMQLGSTVHTSPSSCWTQNMPGPAKSGVLIYAKNLKLVSRFYEKLLPAKVVLADSEHRVLQSEDAQLIIHAIPAQYADGIEITAPPTVREERAIKPFFTVASLENAEQVVMELGGLVCGPVWPGPSMRVRNVCDPEGNIIHLRQSAD